MAIMACRNESYGNNNVNNVMNINGNNVMNIINGSNQSIMAKAK
jgi:hypothetical protein